MFEQMCNSIVTIIKPDGRKFENIRANVQPTKIFIHDASLPIEEGDSISRNLPNGLNERYLVLDRGFHDTFHSIQAHYQIKVRKESAISTHQSSPIVCNLQGNNSRININSNDSSINITQVANEDLFKQIHNIIEKEIAEKETRSLYLQQLAELKQSVGSAPFLEKYQQFIATTANHMSILYPFIPALTKLLNIG